MTSPLGALAPLGGARFGRVANVVLLDETPSTNDVARAFRRSTTEAEALKLQHGDAMVSAAGRTRRLPLPAAAGEAPRAAKL